MGFLLFFPFLTLLLPLIFAPSTFAFCPTTTCPNDTLTPIRFPFHLENHNPENCSYPGFNLHCTNRGHTAITLPHSGEFLVRHINYETQVLLLDDPNECLPQKLLEGFDPSGSPFQAEFYVNYTFLRCPRDLVDSQYTVIDCLSNSQSSMIAIPPSEFSSGVAGACEVIQSLWVPVETAEDGGLTSGLGEGIWIAWHVPECGDCESKGGVCGFQNGSQQIGCFEIFEGSDDPEQSQNRNGLKVFRIIAFSIAIPAIFCAVGVGLFLCIMDRRDRIRNAQANRQQNAATLQPLETATGLDQATINSYTKVVLGESRRIPGVNDGSCPICLSDFKAKETLRCIPDCKHCFHADCIDEWLKLNGTCPLCRTSPAPHESHDQV